jgi:hypothetical protein
MVSAEKKDTSFPRTDIAQVQAKRAWPTNSNIKLWSVPFNIKFDAPNFDCIGIMISNAFGSLLASAILDNMDGVMGLAAWR